jgi:N-acetylmuramoyl-L-alanine amidase
VQEARAELALLQNSQSPDFAKRELGKSAIARSAGSVGEKAEGARSSDGKAETAREYAAESAQPSSNASSASNAADEYVLVPKANGRPPQIRKISTRATSDSTKVEIDLDGAVQYTSGRIANPDRIFFDLQAARLPPQVVHNILKPAGTVLSAVRVAQSRSGVVRVVLDVNGVADYSASLLGSSAKGGAARLVIALYSKADANARAIETAKAQGDGGNPQTREETTSGKSVDTRRGAGINPQLHSDKAIESLASTDVPTVTGEKPIAKSARADGEDPLIVPKDERKTANAKDVGSGTVLPQPKNKLGLAKTGKGGVGVIQPASIPQPTRDGQSTLTRALGLKIGRIVIDAGHGGHDTGTIGPTGLMEKDLCLDVALRLGKIIQQRLPSADVVYTRSDDTFIPLEERTHIANEAKADMFISIHANSSGNSDARGIETYYLNLKGSDEAMEVAARENSTSGQGIHELQDLVKQIARTEKIDESKEFAEDVQDSLAKRVQKAAKPVKNRGVRKAPFVVLIGADMPSILTEISFLSNPADEKMLKQPEHRQRVAEGIYQGVASYLQSLNSMGVNQTASPMPKRTDTSASVQDSRNRN